MSDPMTNTEVEDVLASIRRLVSDDNRPETEEKTSALTDRLVLTPALRVTEDPASDDVGDEEDDHPDATATAPGDPDEGAAETAQDGTESDVEMMDDAPLDVEDHEVADPIEAPEHEAISDDDEGGEPITLDTVDLDQDTLMSIQDAFTEGGDSAGPAAVQANAPPPPTEASSLSAKIAALETLIAGQTEEFEPEKAGDGANAGTEPPTLEWEDAEDAYVEDVQEPEPEQPIKTEKEDTQIFASDEDVLDEDALRDLVSDIVREELQGALGERITRNVRKLVRREIHRALAAQDLE